MAADRLLQRSNRWKHRFGRLRFNQVLGHGIHEHQFSVGQHVKGQLLRIGLPENIFFDQCQSLLGARPGVSNRGHGLRILFQTHRLIRII